jgi:hypothetical protein
VIQKNKKTEYCYSVENGKIYDDLKNKPSKNNLTIQIYEKKIK